MKRVVIWACVNSWLWVQRCKQGRKRRTIYADRRGVGSYMRVLLMYAHCLRVCGTSYEEFPYRMSLWASRDMFREDMAFRLRVLHA